ncbi:MAG: acyl-protein synthetase, partial [Chthoniobacterales bacterium]
EATHSSLSQMAEWLEPEAFFMRAGKLASAELRRKLDSTNHAVTLFGTALAFLHYFEERHTHQLPEGSIAIETGGYKGSGREISKTELYALFKKHLGLPPASVFNEYGMTELSSQFYSHGLGTPHHCPRWARVVVINPASGLEVEDGNPGILKIYDLANLGSVCAILTQDLAIRHGGDFELIGRDPAALPRGCSRSADEMLRR